MHSTVLITLNVDCAASSTKDKQLYVYVVPMSALSYTFHKLTLPINFAS